MLAIVVQVRRFRALLVVARAASAAAATHAMRTVRRPHRSALPSHTTSFTVPLRCSSCQQLQYRISSLLTIDETDIHSESGSISKLRKTETDVS